MTIQHVDVGKLSDEQLRSMLALGTKAESSPSSRSVVDLLRESFSQAGSDKMQSLVADLKCPVLGSDDGPLSFRRLTKVSDDEAAELAGKSFVQVLTSTHTSQRALEHLAEFGRLVCSEVFPSSTRITGAVIAAFAQAALAFRYGVSVDSEKANPGVAVLKVLSTAKALPDSLRSYAQQAIRKGD